MTIPEALACDFCRREALTAIYKPEGTTRGLTVYLCGHCGLVQSAPRIARTAERHAAAVSGGADSLGPMFGEATRLYWFVGLMIAGLGVTVSEGLVHLLYGQRYDGAIPALMWHLVLAGFLVVNAAAAAALTSAGRQSDRIRIYAVALVVDLVLALVLVPLLAPRGPMPAGLGAAIALATALTLGSVLKSRRLHKDLGARVAGLRWALIGATAGALALALPLRRLPDLWQLVFGIPAVMLVYGVIVWRWGLKAEDRVLFTRA